MTRFFATCFCLLVLPSLSFGQQPSWWDCSHGELVQVGTESRQIQKSRTVYDTETRQREVTRYIPTTEIEQYQVRVPRTETWTEEIQVPQYAQRVRRLVEVEELVPVDLCQMRTVSYVPTRTTTTRTYNNCNRSTPTRSTTNRRGRDWSNFWGEVQDGRTRSSRIMQLGMINLNVEDQSDDDTMQTDDDINEGTFRRRIRSRLLSRR